MTYFGQQNAAEAKCTSSKARLQKIFMASLHSLGTFSSSWKQIQVSLLEYEGSHRRELSYSKEITLAQHRPYLTHTWPEMHEQAHLRSAKPGPDEKDHLYDS